MSREGAAGSRYQPLLGFLKEVSGKRIEEARRRRRITQSRFATQVGFSERWLREVEAGNPASTLDAHIICARYLTLPMGHVLFPLLFFAHDMAYPQQLAYGDLVDLERLCIDLIAERNLRNLTSQLTPRWWPSAGAA